MLALAVVVGSAVARADGPMPVVDGQSVYELKNGNVALFVTETGGHMTALFARAGERLIAPYHTTPWQEEGLKLNPPILRVLRGDFFCLPFGGNGEAFNGETHLPHGETANGQWEHRGSVTHGDLMQLNLVLETKVRPGKVSKVLTLIAGHPAIYSTHKIEGFAGPAPLGHHATLALPETEGAFRVATSPIRFGLTNPTLFSDPAKREYQSLAIGARFNDLRRVPQLFKDAPDADCTRFPARRGYADLLCVVNDGDNRTPAWTAAVNVEAGYLWFALKDATLLPTTVLWIENGGRHGEPWRGRNNCLGLEDVCAHFADGLAASARDNTLTKEGVQTAVQLHADRPTSVHYIQGAVTTPPGFEVVERAEFTADGVTFISPTGLKIAVPVKHSFVFNGAF